MKIDLHWHKYKYYPYEEVLALREIESLLAPAVITHRRGAVTAERPAHPGAVDRLVYFASSSSDSAREKNTLTQQSMLERVNGNGPNRQSTRYSVHGLHEYKGKFNPQIAKAMLNIFGAMPGQHALDPFCGSGTSLVECAHLGISATGTDINPLAVMLANAKLAALGTRSSDILAACAQAIKGAKSSRYQLPQPGDARVDYLLSWFPADILRDLERLRLSLETVGYHSRAILLALGSNLLRDYSLQDPDDLRIRRRKSPLPTTSFLDAFESACVTFCTKLSDSQQTLGVRPPPSKAVLADCRELAPNPALPAHYFDLALTSPPYATALPYIDTQRLSLVWLGLAPASEIFALESTLIGSREIRGGNKSDLLAILQSNQAGLPQNEAALCVELQRALSDKDGFRRQAAPRLLYRYFAGMADVFKNVHSLMKPNAPFGLIVGGNHTTLGGKRFDIQTPQHLASIAVSRGWTHLETIELQTYKRYGVHAENSTTTEAMVILRA